MKVSEPAAMLGNAESKPRIALLSPVLMFDGGVQEIARWLYHSIAETREFEVELISVAASRSDHASRRLVKPATWIGFPRVETIESAGSTTAHVGANWVEWESQRYQPRAALEKILSSFDLVQVVAGTPAWANIVARSGKPCLLQAATLSRLERQTLVSKSSGFKRVYHRVNGRLIDRLDLAGLRRADLTFVENRWMHDFVVKNVGAGRVALAPPGVDTEFFSPSRSKPALPFVLCVGRLNDPRKNHTLLFEAYALASRQRAKAPPLVLAGTGQLLPASLDQLRRLGLANQVTVHSNLSRLELANLYRQAGVFVLSSNEEGFGIVLLEALASGLPIVSTACGGPQEIVVDGVTGFLTPVGDARAIANRLSELWDNPERSAEVGRAARELAVAKFSHRAAAARFLLEYQRRLGTAKVSIR